MNKFTMRLAPRLKAKHCVVPMIYFLYLSFDVVVINVIKPIERRVSLPLEPERFFQGYLVV